MSLRQLLAVFILTNHLQSFISHFQETLSYKLLPAYLTSNMIFVVWSCRTLYTSSTLWWINSQCLTNDYSWYKSQKNFLLILKFNWYENILHSVWLETQAKENSLKKWRTLELCMCYSHAHFLTKHAMLISYLSTYTPELSFFKKKS